VSSVVAVWLSKLLVTKEAAYLGDRRARRSPGKRQIMSLMAETFDIESALDFMASARVCRRDSNIFDRT
jgi:hypothetical protein